jgi:hypothetical protein
VAQLEVVLFGHAGAAAVDEAALLELLHRVSALAEGVPELAELTLSPVWAAPGGVTVGGARVRVDRPPIGPGPLLRRLR